MRLGGRGGPLHVHCAVFSGFTLEPLVSDTQAPSSGFWLKWHQHGGNSIEHITGYQDISASMTIAAPFRRTTKALLTLAKTDLYTHGEGVERGEKVYGVIPSQRPNPSSIPHVHYPQINDAKPKGLPSPISSKSLCWQTGLKFSHFTFAVNNPIIPSLFTESQRPSGKHLYK